MDGPVNPHIQTHQRDAENQATGQTPQAPDDNDDTQGGDAALATAAAALQEEEPSKSTGKEGETPSTPATGRFVRGGVLSASRTAQKKERQSGKFPPALTSQYDSSEKAQRPNGPWGSAALWLAKSLPTGSIAKIDKLKGSLFGGEVRRGTLWHILFRNFILNKMSPAATKLHKLVTSYPPGWTLNALNPDMIHQGNVIDLGQYQRITAELYMHALDTVHRQS